MLLFTSEGGRSHVGETLEKQRPLLLHLPGEERAVILNAAAMTSHCLSCSGHRLCCCGEKGVSCFRVRPYRQTFRRHRRNRDDEFDAGDVNFKLLRHRWSSCGEKRGRKGHNVESSEFIAFTMLLFIAWSLAQ